MKKMFYLVIVGLLVGFVGCSKKSSAPASVESAANSLVLKVAVSSNGELTMDGKASTIEDLKKELGALKERNGSVWYYREVLDSNQAPPPVAMEVMLAVVEAHLPLRLCSKPDFSDGPAEVDGSTTTAKVVSPQ